MFVVVVCLFGVVRCSLFVAGCTSSVVCPWLFVLLIIGCCCLLFVVCGLPCVVC